MQTLDYELSNLSSALAGSLVSAKCFADIGHTVRGVPSALTGFFGFECPLGTTEPVADFSLRINAAGEREALAGASVENPLPERLWRSPVWRQVRRFGEAWVDPASPLAAQLSELWLEFDVSATTALDSEVPNVFLLIQRDVADRNDDRDRYRPNVERSLALLSGAEFPPPVLRSLRTCMEAVPNGPNRSFFLGLMLGRRNDSVRICVRGLRADQIPEYLETIGWRGPRDAACEALLPLAQHAERLTLDLDAGEMIGLKLGLEYRLPREGGTAAVAEFLDALVARDLCVAAKRQGLIDWIGRIFEPENGPAPPQHLSAALWLSGLWASSSLTSQLNHVKITLEPGCHKLSAKAYLALERRWRVCR
jgi:hypothetical protein